MSLGFLLATFVVFILCSNNECPRKSKMFAKKNLFPLHMSLIRINKIECKHVWTNFIIRHHYYQRNNNFNSMKCGKR